MIKVSGFDVSRDSSRERKTSQNRRLNNDLKLDDEQAPEPRSIN